MSRIGFSIGYVIGYVMVAQMLKSPPAMQETWVRSLGREDPLEKGMAISLVFLPGESYGQRSLTGSMGSMGLHRVRHD